MVFLAIKKVMPLGRSPISAEKGPALFQKRRTPLYSITVSVSVMWIV
jgi:hypothetical protein